MSISDLKCMHILLSRVPLLVCIGRRPAFVHVQHVVRHNYVLLLFTPFNVVLHLCSSDQRPRLDPAIIKQIQIQRAQEQPKKALNNKHFAIIASKEKRNHATSAHYVRETDTITDEGTPIVQEIIVH